MTKKTTKSAGPSLSERVEKIVETTQADDILDPDILDHVRHFLNSPIPTMEPFSLLTQESARQAMSKLEAAHKVLEERVRTARMLKTLCEQSRKDTPEM